MGEIKFDPMAADLPNGGMPYGGLNQGPALAAFDQAARDRFLATKKTAPAAADMSDTEFALASHQHYYSDVPLVDYLSRLGFDRRSVIDETMGTPFYQYAIKALETPGANETPEQAAARYGGKLATKEPGFFENIARAFGQGGMFGWGDEVTAAGAAALDPLVHGDRGKDFGERYDAYLGRERGRIDDFREENPIAAYGSEIAGAIPTSITAGMMAAPLAGGSNFARVFTPVVSGIAEGGVYGAGAADGDVADRARAAAGGAVFGAAAGTAFPAISGMVGKLLNKGAVNKATAAAVEAAPSAAAIKAAAQQSYKAAEDTGAIITDSATNLLGQDVRQMLSGEGLLLPKSGALVDGYPKVRGALATLDEYAGEAMTIKQAQSVQRMFRKAAASTDPEEARIGAMMLDTLDDFMDNLPQSGFTGGNGPEAAALWKQAKVDYARSKRTGVIEDAINSAELSGGNFVDAFRSKMRSILDKPKKQRGFNADELAAIRAFVDGGRLEDFQRFLSQGGLLPSTFAGHAAGGPVGAAVAGGAKLLGGAIARGAMNSGARNVAQRIRAEVATPGGLNVPVVSSRNKEIVRLLSRAGGVGSAGATLSDEQRQMLGKILLGRP